MAVTVTSVLGRRGFLVQASKGVLGVAVLGIAAACGSNDDEPGVASGPGHSGSGAGLNWWRVDFAYVSAYVLVRGREAALVDCGFGSRVKEIGAVLETAGTRWDRVRHILITHAHPDHWAGLQEVTTRAPAAALYAGAAEMESLPSWSHQWPFHPVTDGQDVFGLQVVDTPGHTAGHIAVFDTDSRVLVAGDALNNTIDGLEGPMPEFTVDIRTAAESVRKLAALEPQVILFGHVLQSSRTPPLSCDGWPVSNELPLRTVLDLDTLLCHPSAKRTLMPRSGLVRRASLRRLWGSGSVPARRWAAYGACHASYSSRPEPATASPGRRRGRTQRWC